MAFFTPKSNSSTVVYVMASIQGSDADDQGFESRRSSKLFFYRLVCWVIFTVAYSAVYIKYI